MEKMNEDLRSELIGLVEAADLCCPEQVCDMVLEASEVGGREAGLAELEKAKANDASEATNLGVSTND